MEAGPTPATLATIYKVINLAHSADVRASRVEFKGQNEFITAHGLDSEALTTRNFDLLNSTDILMLWVGVDVPEDPNSELPPVQMSGQVGPIYSELPLTTITRDAVVADKDGDSNTPENDEED
ncbi:hypothetical protein KY289_001165 [Solanum tuberosum]|nr:hypothetical protein KY289_001165 [Solanum tuberosum]